MNKNTSRRSFVKNAAATGAGLFAVSSLLQAQEKDNSKKKKIVCVGGHPDDPESGCGGTLAKYAADSNDVTIIYLTTGEAGILNKSHDEAATIRKQESIEACKLLKAKPVFAGQIDGDTIVNTEWINKIHKLIESESPDIVFTHWPIDSHKDHQAASLLTIQAWMRTKDKWPLYFFEVCTGEQTMIFKPTDYVDITTTQELKRKSIYCHTSQNPADIYTCGHAAMEDFRGREYGVHAAEAFIKLNAADIKNMLL